MSDPRLRKRTDSELAVSRDAVDKLKGRLSKFDGLVSTSSAARMLGISSSNFGEYYVRPGRMEPALVLGRNRNYFRLRDIEHILRAREDQDEMLTSQQVADTCGVYISCVYKWSLAGVLKPVARRSVGGHIRDLYRRKDAEKLLAEREAFKAKRIEEGKTDRTGRPSGPQKSPVQELIGPRIKTADQRLASSKSSCPYLGRPVTSTAAQRGLSTRARGGLHILATSIVTDL